MKIQTILLCSDVRKEVGGTNSLIGQFTSVSGGLFDELSFCVFFGLTDFRGMAVLNVVIEGPDKEVVMKFDTGGVACINRSLQYVANFKVNKMPLRSYGNYNLKFYHEGKESGNLEFKYRLSSPMLNKIVIGNKEVEVPRMNLGDPNELQEYSKLFVRKFKKLDKHFRTVRFHSQFNPSDGIGSVSIFLVKQMLSHGVRVKPIPFIPCKPDLDFVASIETHNIPPSSADLTIVNALPPHLIHAGAAKRLLLFTYWEADTVNSAWINVANTTDALFVPSQFVKDVYKRGGVTKPILVYRQPISSRFQYKPKKENEYFTILFIGTCIPRKGIDLFCKACDKVFANDPKVRFRIHTKPWSANLGDKRSWLLNEYGDNLKYSITDHTMSVDEIYNMMTEADVLVAPSRSEGLGLIPIQSVMSGTPALIPNHSGFKEYSDTKGIVTVDTNRKVKGEGIYAGGNWYEPDFDELCASLEFAKNNRKELLEDVKEGANILRQKYDAKAVYLGLETMINNVYMR